MDEHSQDVKMQMKEANGIFVELYPLLKVNNVLMNAKVHILDIVLESKGNQKER
jgi:hypothetical protein